MHVLPTTWEHTILTYTSDAKHVYCWEDYSAHRAWRPKKKRQNKGTLGNWSSHQSIHCKTTVSSVFTQTSLSEQWSKSGK